MDQHVFYHINAGLARLTSVGVKRTAVYGHRLTIRRNWTNGWASVSMDLSRFLDQVLIVPESYLDDLTQAHLCVCVSGPGGAGLYDNWFHWPQQKADVLSLVHESTIADLEVYFVPHLFDAVNGAPLATRTIAVDLDSADIGTTTLAPTLLVQTSPRRVQAYWTLKADCEVDLAEAISRNIAFSIPKADSFSWPLTTPFRLPETVNHKYLEQHTITILNSSTHQQYDAADLELIGDAPPDYDAEQRAFVDSPPTLDQCPYKGPLELLRYAVAQNKATTKIEALYNVAVSNADRHSYLWSLLLQTIGNGMNRTDAYWLGKFSPNNPFQNLVYHADRELAKEVLRAEAYCHTRRRDARELIAETRRGLDGAIWERKQQLFNVVIDNMRADGEFVRTGDYTGYYIRKDRGRPILIGRRSHFLQALLALQYGLNHTETEHSYCAAELEAHVQSLPISGREVALSYYDTQAQAIYIHSGKRDVYRISTDSVDRLTDGAHSLVFPWPTNAEPFAPVLPLPTTPTDPLSHRLWFDVLFGDAVPNVVGLSQDQATVILTAWFMMVLTRNVAADKPILAMFGQPGGGKTFLFRRVFRLLYGKARNIGAITTPENFDQACITEPLAVFDNVDDVSGWILNKLAQVVGSIDVPVRMLYTNADTVVLKRQAMVGLTAHKPEFNRPDVADRLLIVTLERHSEGTFVPGRDILDSIYRLRPHLWGAIFRTLQTLLRTPPPPPGSAPSFRIQDYATLGYWYMLALDRYIDDLGLPPRHMAVTFQRAIVAIARSQQGFALEEDSLIVQAFSRIVKSKPEGEWLRSAQLFDKLAMQSDDEAFRKQYGTPAKLARHLVSLQHPLQSAGIVKVDWMYEPGGAAKLWRATSLNGHKEQP